MKERIVPEASFKKIRKFDYVVEKGGQKIRKSFEYERELMSHIVLRIVDLFADDRLTPTLRQIYYQIIGKDLAPNCVPFYDNLGDLVKQMREQGILDWSKMEDRTRKFQKRYTEESVVGAFERTHSSYRLDLQRDQSCLLIVMSEKDAISQIVARACYGYSGVYHINRGYCSADAIYKTYLRIVDHLNADPGNTAKIIYCGDFDPSGVDMDRDIYDRVLMALCNGTRYKIEPDGFLEWEERQEAEERRREAYEYMNDLFRDCCDDQDYKDYASKGFIAWDQWGDFPPYDEKKRKKDYHLYYVDEPGIRYGDIMRLERFEVVRAFLTIEQIEELGLPPNPAKQTDSRFRKYARKYGVSDSWELDALSPSFIIKTLKDLFEKYLDMDKVEALRSQETDERRKVERVKDLAQTEEKLDKAVSVANRLPQETIEALDVVLETGAGIDLKNWLVTYLQDWRDKLENDE